VTDFPGEHPEPPSDLGGRSPLFVEITPGTVFSRIHNRSTGPVFFGRTGGNRFDAPDGSYGVLYVESDEHCAFIETFGQDTGTRLVTRRALVQRHLSYLEVTEPLNLVDLAASGGLARIGADAGLSSGSHRIAQRWSAALRNHPSKPAGLVYPARHDAAGMPAPYSIFPIPFCKQRTLDLCLTLNMRSFSRQFSIPTALV